MHESLDHVKIQGLMLSRSLSEGRRIRKLTDGEKPVAELIILGI